MRHVRSLVGKIPWRRKWQPTPVFFPGKSHGQRSLVDCSPWGCKRVRHDLVTKQQQCYSRAGMCIHKYICTYTCKYILCLFGSILPTMLCTLLFQLPYLQSNSLSVHVDQPHFLRNTEIF